MQPDFTKGGRYKIAPYKTTHVRIPEAIKDYVTELSNQYKVAVNEHNEQQFLESLIKPVNKKKLIDLANTLLKLQKQKKSTKEAIQNLLTAILEE